MTQSAHFGNLARTTSREVEVISTLLHDLQRKIELLEADIDSEEASRGVRDLSDPRYPCLARSLRTRRDNIKATVASLETRLAAIAAARHSIAA